MLQPKFLFSTFSFVGIFFIAYLFFSFTISQENKNRERIEFLKYQIHQVESQLKDYKNNKESFISLIQARQGLIRNRTDLIERLKEEIDSGNFELKKLDEDNKLSLKTLDVYKKDYELAARSKFIQHLNYSHALLPDQKEWNSYVKKMIWNEQFNQFRIHRFRNYKKSLESVLSKKKEIRNKIENQKEMLNIQQVEKEKIDKDINQLNIDYNIIQSKIKDYKSTLDKYNREMLQLEKLINQSISDAAKTYSATSSPTNIGWTFPLEGGAISSPFGTSRDPKHPQLTIKNNGIDIRSRESFVRSSVDAQVIQIRQLDNGSFFLLTQAGEYYQVYSNLDKVFVKAGESIVKSSNLGELRQEANGQHSLHFEVWKGRTPVDPQRFIGR